MKQQETNSDFLAVHEDVVKRVLDKQPAEEELYDLAELFKVFGDSTRIRILHALLETELCVGDMAQILNLSQSAVSHQLKILKDAKLVRFRREGKIIFYALDDEHVRNILSMGVEHVQSRRRLRKLCSKDGRSSKKYNRCKRCSLEFYDIEIESGI